MSKVLGVVMAIGMTVAMCGCSASTQAKIDSYKQNRDAVASKVKEVHGKKECIKLCNANFSIGLNRANCKAECASPTSK